ncbi:MAG TPA: hypothetical protein ACFYD7_09905 [Candidatus Wujingus californicus]
MKRAKSQCILYYEFAPTGLLHAGILRTMLRVEKTRSLAIQKGLAVKAILGIGDRTALKKQLHFPNFEKHINSQLVDIPNPVTNIGTYYDYFCEDIYRTVKKYNIHFDQYIRIGELYESDTLRDVLDKIFGQQSNILSILANSQRNPPTIFFPKCEKCGKMYYSRVQSFDQDGQSKYVCNNCNYNGICSILKNRGAFTFKLEMAIIWRLLGVDFQFAGQDHYEAIMVAQKIYNILFGNLQVIPYIVNLTITDGKNVARKSLGNFRPVSNLNPLESEKLLYLLERTPDKRLLILPKSLQP